MNRLEYYADEHLESFSFIWPIYRVGMVVVACIAIAYLFITANSLGTNYQFEIIVSIIVVLVAAYGVKKITKAINSVRGEIDRREIEKVKYPLKYKVWD